jgi:hypothetical protein
VEPALSSILMVLFQIALVPIVALRYLRRARVDRPPVGVFNGRDLAVVGTVLVILPAVYLRLPAAVLGAVFGLLSVAILYFALTPVVGPRRSLLVGAVLVALDVLFWRIGREQHPWLFPAINNLTLAIAVVGVGNLWVQSGIRASHVALLACGLSVFDAGATLALPLMGEFVDRISTLPLTPMLTWGSGPGAVGIGLGDILILVVWTLVAEKAFSRRAGTAAAALGAACVAALFTVFWLDLVNRPLPAMLLLGPCIAIHYGVLIRRIGRERTFAQYEATLTWTSRTDDTAARPARSEPATTPVLLVPLEEPVLVER